MLERIWTNQDGRLDRGEYTLPYRTHYREDESGDFILISARRKMRDRKPVICASLGLMRPDDGYVAYLENGRFVEALLFPDWRRIDLKERDDAEVRSTIGRIRTDWLDGPHRSIFFPVKYNYGDPYATKNMPAFLEAWVSEQAILSLDTSVLRHAS